MSVELVIGTRNVKKWREISDILRGPGLVLRSLDDFPATPEPVEDGATFAENAAKKARELSEALGRLVAADDSGLEVDALGGRPGVLSARYAGKHGDDAGNIAKLLEEMRGVRRAHRGARFRCAAALAERGRLLTVVDGTLEGEIGEEPRGSNGFGYDPVFVVRGLGRTCAELTADEKNRISHRGTAFRRLRGELTRLIPGLEEEERP